MAGKRSATSELNHDNWDTEEPVENAGTFQRATEDVIKRRVIKTAKRRNPISGGEEGEKKNIFGGFTAFAKNPPPVSNAFNFLTNIDKNTQPTKTNGVSNNSDEKTEIKTTIANNFQKPIMNTSEDDKSNYYPKIKGLNESVSKWIKDHVDNNPFVNLQPIFKDYEKYYEELEKEHKNKETNLTKPDIVVGGDNVSSFKFKPADNTNAVTSTTFSFGSNKEQLSNNKKTEISPTFAFGSSNVTKDSSIKTDPPISTSLSSSIQEAQTFKFGSATTVNTTTSSFSFNTTSTVTASNTSTMPTFSFGNTNVSSGFKFGSTPSTGFTFAGVTANPTTDSDKKNTNEEDSEEPPKNEFTPVVEKDHLYTIRCKVFVKKDKTFGDRGVGNLYLKPIPDSEKVQLIVRADTNLGNLLCNFVLSESIPTQRMGKKDVMLVCIPTPDCKPPPTPILLRVKSSEDADELLSTLEKHKK